MEIMCFRFLFLCCGLFRKGGYRKCYVQLAMAKDPEGAFFKRLEGLQPCEVSELKAGTHIFAVYGLNNLFCNIDLFPT